MELKKKILLEIAFAVDMTAKAREIRSMVGAALVEARRLRRKAESDIVSDFVAEVERHGTKVVSKRSGLSYSTVARVKSGAKPSKNSLRKMETYLCGRE